MRKEIWIWYRAEHETGWKTSWIRATDLEDAADIIDDVLGESIPYPVDWPPQFDSGEEVELEGRRGRIFLFHGGWTVWGGEDMEVYEVEVEEDL